MCYFYTALAILHNKATLDSIKAEKLVLIAQGKTEVCFTGRKKIKGIGY